MLESMVSNLGELIHLLYVFDFVVCTHALKFNGCGICR